MHSNQACWIYLCPTMMLIGEILLIRKIRSKEIIFLDTSPFKTNKCDFSLKYRGVGSVSVHMTRTIGYMTCQILVGGLQLEKEKFRRTGGKKCVANQYGSGENWEGRDWNAQGGMSIPRSIDGSKRGWENRNMCWGKCSDLLSSVSCERISNEYITGTNWSGWWHETNHQDLSSLHLNGLCRISFNSIVGCFIAIKNFESSGEVDGRNMHTATEKEMREKWKNSWQKNESCACRHGPGELTATK